MALLEPFDIVNAILQIIFIGTTITVGLIIASKYSIHKDRIFLMVGFAWIGLVEPWMASVSNFFYVMITGRMFDVRIYLLIGITFIPLSLTFWFVAITDLMYKEKQKLILSVIIIYGILFEIYFLYYLINDPSVLAVLHGVINIEYKLPIQLYVFSVLVLGIITGLLFSHTSMTSQNPEVQLKGKLLFVAFILYVVGAISDTIFLRDIPTLFITRIILISASIFFYFGFILPNFLRNTLKLD